MLGWQNELDWFWEATSDKFQSKHRGIIGPGNSDLEEMQVLNRIVSWTPEGITYEADQRHVEICLQELGPDESSN